MVMLRIDVNLWCSEKKLLDDFRLPILRGIRERCAAIVMPRFNINLL